VSDYYEFMLFMKQCRALMSDMHLVKMFCSTENCALAVLYLKQAPGDPVFLLVQISYRDRNVLQNGQEKKAVTT